MESAKHMQPLRTVKFNFDNVFGAKDGGAQASAPRARSSYSADEVEMIRKDSLSQGKADVEAAALALQAQTLGAIAHSLTTVISQFDATVTALRQESAQLALAVGRKLAEHALAAYPLDEVQALLADCLHKMHGEPRRLNCSAKITRSQAARSAPGGCQRVATRTTSWFDSDQQAQPSVTAASKRPITSCR